jgi:hypothetical protein
MWVRQNVPICVVPEPATITKEAFVTRVQEIVVAGKCDSLAEKALQDHLEGKSTLL